MGKLYVVSTPIGNLKDITLRALETLKDVDMILCEDTRQSIKLLNHYNIKNKLTSYHKFNEKEKTNKILKELETKDIALISDAGTPCISDPGYILIKEAKEKNIEVIPIGGISACITALSVSGLDSNNFTFYGFFPRETKDKNKLLKEIEKNPINTLIFYESPKRIINTLEYIYENLGNINISVSSDLTKLHEKNYYGKIEKVIKQLKENPKSTLGEYTFIIEKETKTEEKNNNISIEAELIDIMIKNEITLKESIEVLNNDKNISKKDIYNASLNLKKLFK